MTYRPSISVPEPFDGTSGWLQAANKSLAPKAMELQADAGDDLQRELNIRRQLDGYLQAFRIDCQKLIVEWELRADLARRRSGIESPEFREAQQTVTGYIERLADAWIEENRAAIRALVELLG